MLVVLDGWGWREDPDGNARPKYEFERDFLVFAQHAHSLAQSLATLHPDAGVPFWLTITDVLELGAADSFDRSILLCSLLNSAGAPGARILVLQLEGAGTHPVVACQFGGQTHVLDPAEGGATLVFTGGVLRENLAGRVCGGKRVEKLLYEFNSEEYSEYD